MCHYVKVNLSALSIENKKKAVSWIEENMPGFLDLLKSPLRGNRRNSPVIIEIKKEILPDWAKH